MTDANIIPWAQPLERFRASDTLPVRQKKIIDINDLFDGRKEAYRQCDYERVEIIDKMFFDLGIEVAEDGHSWISDIDPA